MSVESWLASRIHSRRRSAAKTKRKSTARRKIFEKLEDRRLLAGDWHNDFMPTDVNNDLRVSVLDALLVINQLGANGNEQLPALGAGTRPNHYYDTNGDNVLSALDALWVINDLGLVTRTAKIAQPRVIDVVPVNGTTFLTSYDRPMGASAIDPANYQLTSADGQQIAVLAAQFVEGESVVQLQTAPQSSSSAYTVNIQNVADTSGQIVFFEGRKLTGNPKGIVVSVAATSSTRVVVVFNEPMADNALAPHHYSIKDASGTALLVTNARFDGPLGMVVVLTTAAQTNVPYKLTVSVVTDLQNDGLHSNTGNFQGLSGFTNLISAKPAGPNSILLNFSQPMSDDALTPSSYLIKNTSGVPLPVQTATFIGSERRLVQLVTGPQAIGIYTIQSITATDTKGNRVSAPGSAGVFEGAPAPSLIAAIPTDTTHLFLTFGSPLSDSGLAPSSYRLEKLDAQGNVTNTLPISETEFVGSQRTVVSLTTPHQSNARYRITTTSGLSDAAGSALAIAALEFLGLGSLPKVTNVTSTGPNTMLVTFNVPMSDEALTPGSYVIKNSSGVTLPVSNAQFVGTDRSLVQLTTGSQVAGIYTIESVTATDLGGNSVESPGAAGAFEGAPAATLSKATPSDPTHLVLVFSGPVGDSALAPSSYNIEKLDNQGNVVGSLTINSAAFVGEQKTVVSLTTPYQSDSRFRISTTTALRDSTGATVAIVQQEFQGVGSPATLVGITSTDPTTIQVIFNGPMSDDALQPSLYVIKDSTGAQLPIYGVQFIGTERRLVQLTTGPQKSGETYTVVSINVKDVSGSTTIIPPSSAINTFPGPGTTGGNSVPVDGPPRLVGAASLSNTSVLVAFSEPMGDNALNTAHYFIVQQNINAEVGFVPILSADFYSDDHRSIVLTTGSQNELTYSITAVNVTDQAGNALAPAVIAGQQRIDPTTASFPGTPPSGAQIVDSDGDGLSDNVEVRGWTVTVTLLNGNTVTREVTSDPNNPDTDNDGLWDAQELNIGIDPRSADTDGDQLSDWAEFNEIYSDPTNQDSDGDSLDDFLEFAFFKTSPYLADSDGDQIADDDEIFANRNPRVADLPRPEISVGEVNLQLDVRFSESNDQERRDLETKSLTSTLSQSNSQTFSRSDTVNLEAHLGVETGFGDGSATGGSFIKFEGGASAGYTFNQSSESATATEQAYERSLSTDREVTRGFTVQREVEGAVMQVTVDLRNLSNLAYRVKNLQVTAFIQDPQDHSRLTPVATLLPDSEPEEGFTLGPLVSEKGPLIFSNDAITPSLVEALMANSSGLIFRISNYDIIDEADRNFAFTSEEIVERTSRLVIDYGGASSLRALLGGEAFDELQPGDETEIYRVATSAGQVIDTNFDGAVDDSDRRAIFDAIGKEVGITLFEALDAVGLTRYQAGGPTDPLTGALAEYELGQPVGTPPVSLTDDQILTSYSTFTDTSGLEKIYRIRGLANDAINQKYWETLTPLGIDRFTDLNHLVLKSNTPVSLNFVQDLDGDRLSADVEFFLRTSDSPLPAGANVPGSTDFTTDESVTYSTDPGYVTGTSVRITESGIGLSAGQDYFVRKLHNEVVDGSASFAFYNTVANAANLASTIGRVDLTDEIAAGIFSPSIPTSTNTTSDFVVFANDPAFPTATLVQVTRSHGGLTAATDYFVRNLGGGSYSFYDSVVNATAGTSVGRIDLTANFTGGVFSPTAKGRDTDRDGLDDRFEALIGWMVNTPQRTYRVYPSPNRADSNFDAVKPITDSDEDGIEDRLEYDASDYYAAPDGWNDKNNDGLRDQFEVYQQVMLSGVRGRDYVLDPTRKDTDGDGLSDATEIIGFRITRIENGQRPLIDHTDPNNPFTDSDTFSDGFEKLVGLDPTDGSDTDVDGDGLPDIVEQVGWWVGKAFPELQQVTVATSGTFSLQFGSGPSSADNTIAALSVDATPRALEQRLNLLKVVRDSGGILTVTSATNGFTVSFGGALAGQNQDPLISTSATVVTLQQGRVRLEEVSTKGYERGELTALRGYSSTDSVDTDGDGLTDFEEFFLRTDASWKDSDGDGIEDRVEYLGYALGHEVGGKDLGYIKTDPLDADTDNDKRSDGAEAELVDIEQNAWIVRVRGETPYRVWSHPLKADADFDGLVDGDEFTFDAADITRHTDPNLGDTDGDFRDDGVERGPDLTRPALTNPLAVDTRVTVVAESVSIDGQLPFNVALTVRTPDSGQVAGLSASQETVFASNAYQIGRIEVHTFLGGQTKVKFLYRNASGVEVLTGVAKTIAINPATNQGYDHLSYDWKGVYDPGANGVPLNATFRFVAYNTPGGAGYFTSIQEFTYTGNNSIAFYDVGDGGFNVPSIVPPAVLDSNLPLKNRSFTFGLANDERFSIEGFVTLVTSSGNVTQKLGGLEGVKASQDGDQGSSTTLRPVFSWDQVADKFIEDYYFKTTLNGVEVEIKFYFIIG